ncbi:MAG: PorP/SprF family type IX secretion system membrane protein [Cyclobacteriaceae bacterium]|nr:PorP/SprF family type IX secretion system membrane protein [Cyclobacteriaceae bacterium]
MRFFSVVFLFFAAYSSFAQEIANFTHFFVNPYMVNPSYAGIEGRSAFFLTYHKQWVNFPGAPQIANVSYHNAVGKHANLGLSFNNDKRSLLKTSSGLLSFAYTAWLSEGTYLRFGISAGAASNTVDLAQVDNPDDPAFISAFDQNFFLLGNAGLSLHAGDFHFGVSMPDVFNPNLVSDEEFSFGDIRPQEKFIVHANYRFYFSNDEMIFEPYIMYRYRKLLPPQLEAATLLHLNHMAWVGGAYKQDYGISALAGVKLPEVLALGYSYTFKGLGINEVGYPSHEITLGFVLGAKQEDVHRYSFIDSKKQKRKVIVKKETEVEPVKEQEKEPEIEKITVIDTVTVMDTVTVVENIEQTPVDTVTIVEVEKQDVEKDTVAVIVDPEANLAAMQSTSEPDVVRRGGHLLEIPAGQYVMVGVFSNYENAEKLSDDLFMRGYHEAKFGYITQRGFWYVYIHKSDDIELSRQVRNSVRGMDLFKEAWVMTIED